MASRTNYQWEFRVTTALGTVSVQARARSMSIPSLLAVMKIKQITVPISQEHPQPTKVSLKSIEGDLDVMVQRPQQAHRRRRHHDRHRNLGKQDADLAPRSTLTHQRSPATRRLGWGISTMPRTCRPAARTQSGSRWGPRGSECSSAPERPRSRRRRVRSTSERTAPPPMTGSTSALRRVGQQGQQPHEPTTE